MNLPVHSKVDGNENEGAGEQVHLGSQDEKVNISENLQPSCSSAWQMHGHLLSALDRRTWKKPKPWGSQDPQTWDQYFPQVYSGNHKADLFIIMPM